MATTKLDIQAVKNAMAQTPWMSYVDAARQVRWVQTSPTPTPIAPVTPAPVAPPPTPIAPTVNVQEQMAGKTVAERQAIRSGEPVAPVTPVAPIVPPVTQPKVDPTPGITPETYNQAKAESERIKAQNEAQMALNKQQSDLRQTETAKANEVKTAEALKLKQDAENQLAQDEWAILTTLKTGWIIPESVKSSPYYKTAQELYNKVRTFSTYSVNNLVWALNNGSILPGTKLYNELLSDPTMKQKLTEAQTFTAKNPVDVAKVTQNASDSILSNNPTLATALSDGVITMDEYNQATNNPEVVAKAKDVETKTNKYNELKAEYDDIENKVKADFPGSPFQDAMIADRQKAKYKNLVLAKWEVDTAIGTMTELKSQASSLFDKNLELYKQRQADEAQIAREQRQVQAQKDMIEYQSDFEKQQQQEALNDPYQAIPAIIEEYKKLGVPFTRSTQQVISDFQSSGQDLPTYLSDLQKLIQSKPEYQKIQSLQQGQLSDAQKMAMSQNFDIKKMGMEQDFQMNIAQAKNITDTKWTKLDDWMYQDASGNIVTKEELQGAKLLNNSNLSKTEWEVGWDCWVYASRSTGMTSTPGGNSKDARTKAFTDKEPQIGWMVFFGWAEYDKTYGHIGIVTGVNPDGTIQVKDSNYWNDGKVQVRTVPQSTATGFYNNTPLAQSVNTGTQATWPLPSLWQFMKDNQDRGTGYSNDDVKAFNEKIDRLVNAGDEKWMAIAYRNMVMKDKDFKKEFDDTKSFTTALDTVQKLVDDYEKSGKDSNKLKAIAESVGRKLGMTTDTALAQLQTQMGTTMANYIKSISGTAASDAEVQRLMGNMANIGNVKDLNTAIISQVKSNALNGIKSMIDTRMYWMPEELKPQVFGDVYWTTNTKLSALTKILANIAKNAPKQ